MTTCQRLRDKPSPRNILFLLGVLASEVFKTLEHDKLCLCSWLASITVVINLIFTTPMGVTCRTTLKCHSIRGLRTTALELDSKTRLLKTLMKH